MFVDPMFDAALERAWAVTSRGLSQWDDPHAGEPPAEDEYSRVTDPERWRIIGARADAWILALAETDRAIADNDIDRSVAWARPPGPFVTRTDVLRPWADGTIELAIGRTRFGGCDGAGLVIGIGQPAVELEWFPDCGCDACDWGSQPELERIDDLLASVVTGSFRHLVRGTQHITVRRDGARGWGTFGRGRHLTSEQVDAILAAPDPPTDWSEWSGGAWSPSDPAQRTPR